MGLALVVPAYNEEGLVALFRDALIGSQQIAHFEEVVLVDDGSSDSTWTELRALAALDRKFTLIRHTTNRGLGAAIRSGIIQTRSEHVCWAPIDQSFDLAEMLMLAENWHSDSVYIYRRILREELARNFVSSLAHLTFRILFRCDLRHQSGLFVMPRSVFIENMPITQRAISNLELLVRLHHAPIDLRIVEIACYPRIAGASRTFSGRSVVRSLRELIGLVLTDPRLFRWRRSGSSNDLRRDFC